MHESTGESDATLLHALFRITPAFRGIAEHSTTFWNALYSQFRALSCTPHSTHSRQTKNTDSAHHCKPLMLRLCTEHTGCNTQRKTRDLLRNTHRAAEHRQLKQPQT